MTDLNDLAKTVHAANIKWWQDIDTGVPIKRNHCELLALVVSELSECLEGLRKNLMHDKLPHRKMAEVELADAKIRLLDFAAGFGIDLSGFGQGGGSNAVPENRGEAILMLTRAVVICEHMDASDIYNAIRLIELVAKKWGYNLSAAMREKMAFNAQREDHKHEARRIAGGKQF